MRVVYKTICDNIIKFLITYLRLLFSLINEKITVTGNNHLEITTKLITHLNIGIYLIIK